MSEMQATKLNKSQGASMLKAMQMALKPSEKLLEKQKVLLTHLTRNSYKTAEDKLESRKAEKLKNEEEKKQTGFLAGLFGKSDKKEKSGGIWGFLKNNWGKIAILIGLLLTPIKTLVDGFTWAKNYFKEETWKQIGLDIAEAFAIYIAGKKFLTKVAPAFGNILLEALKVKLIKDAVTKSVLKNLPTAPLPGSASRIHATGSRKAEKLARMRATTKPPGPKPPGPKLPGSPSMFGKMGQMARLTGGLVGKVALPAGVAFALFDSKDTFSKEGFQKGMAHAVESFTIGLVPREASEKVFKTVEDGVKEAATSVTKGFVSASNEITDGWKDLKNFDYSTLLDPIKKQIADKKKAAEELTKIPPTSTSLDLSDEAQKGRLRDKIAQAQKDMIAAKGSKAKAKAGQKLMDLKAELASYGVGPIPKTGTRLKATKMSGTSKSGIQQLKDDEGFRSEVYDDTEGIKTIGYGFNLEREGTQKALDSAGIKKSVADLKSGKVNLTEKEAERLMMGEYPYFREAAKRYLGEDKWPPFPESKKDALTNMAYNLGEKSLNKFVNLRTALRNGDFELAGQEVLRSKYATQVGDRAQRISGALSAVVPPMEKSNAFNAQQNMNNELKGSGNGSTVIIDKSSKQVNNNSSGSSMIKGFETDVVGKDITAKTR